MKDILIGVIILIFISLHASGQQAQDTLYLKNGNSAIGKLLWESKEEYRFKTSEGIYFSFSPDEIERIAVAPKMIMRKVNPDTLTANQLNLYYDKAVKMRNTGRALTISGVSIFAIGIVTGVVLLNTAEPHGPPEDPHGSMLGYGVIGLAGLIGIPCTLVGVPLWSVGGSRKTKAEVALQKFNIAPDGSMALGLGITIRF